MLVWAALIAVLTLVGFAFAMYLLYAQLAIIVGLQAVYFFIATRWFGISEGLVPDEPRLRRIVGMLTPELGFVAGLVLITGGLVLSIIAVAMWNREDFGDLAYPEILRIVIPGSTLDTGVFVADDESALRQAISDLVASEVDMEVVGTAASAEASCRAKDSAMSIGMRPPDAFIRAFSVSPFRSSITM